MKYYLTKERLEELKIELKRLEKDARAEIRERLRRAKEYGDLSENAEYSEAKDEQAKVEGRIFELENILKNASIIKKTNGKDSIRIGSTIEVKRGDKIFKYTIVGSNEARPEANLISNESPLGSSFLGKKIGDEVQIQTPGGSAKYKILKME